MSAWADVVIRIDKVGQRMSVSVNGQQLHAWPISSGTAGYDTPSGSFRPLRTERTHFSREWDNAPMPYSIFFTPGGHAIHGTNQVRQLGLPASHGCVRLAPRHAATLFALVRAEGLASTQVVVEGDDVGLGNQVGASIGVDPFAALQRSARARSKWQAEQLTALGATPAVSAASTKESGSTPVPSAPASVAPSLAPAGSPASTTPQEIDRDAVITRLLSGGTQAAKAICTQC
ncbi:L,D-transpeptidase [Methylobacterium iners]|uniref:L,D-TPase catalytic domain-containing protein n=2 Tax=Methylobacterium iners TaxID=418707 RepID=A0ABQ4S576_9HYPH|nr:L,D-transpeptidase [Methylobacterium iners]GJD97633.1 hypothetical protein OCOJLMKI_4866 [Methylobacterium iners]